VADPAARASEVAAIAAAAPARRARRTRLDSTKWLLILANLGEYSVNT
jgi:hypothetical protein